MTNDATPKNKCPSRAFIDPEAIDLDKFWGSVDKTDGCWIWRGKHKQYGSFAVGKQSHPAHRVSWVIHFGPIPDGLFVCHHCDNKPCIRPDHLFLGTHLNNMRDASRKKRWKRGPQTRSHCKRGHAYTDENTLVTPDGHRECRACNRLRWRRVQAKKRGVQVRAVAKNKKIEDPPVPRGRKVKRGPAYFTTPANMTGG